MTVLITITLLVGVSACQDEIKFNSREVTEEAPAIGEEPATEEEVISDSREYIQGETDSERPLDILLVIDNSASMNNLRKGLGTRLGALLSKIKDSDWRLAITTTNAHFCLPKDRIIFKTPNKEFTRDKRDFNKIISSSDEPFCGEICELTTTDLQVNNLRISLWDSVDWGANERPILMAINGLGGDKTFDDNKCYTNEERCQISRDYHKSSMDMNNDAQTRGEPLPYPALPAVFNEEIECAPNKNLCLIKRESWCRGRRSELPATLNNDWLRSESMIAVILVTDENNSENPRDKNGRELLRQVDLNVNELTNYLEGTLDRTRGSSYEIYGILNPLANESYKKIIPDESNRQSVEDTNYQEVLGNISIGIMKVLNKTIDIKDIANKANFSFKSITGKKEGVHYTREGNIITFMEGYIPEKGDKITVNYSHKPTK